MLVVCHSVFLLSKADFTRAASASGRSKALRHLKWFGFTAQPQLKKSSLPDYNFLFIVMKNFPKYANNALFSLEFIFLWLK